MLNFFRKIRRKLAFDNKLNRYMRYAIGEVVLIMLGIFMALQLQNWNEKRKQEAQFKITLEQIYNALHFDTHILKRQMSSFDWTISHIDILIEKADSIPYSEMPYAMYSVVPGFVSEFNSETVFHANNLNYNIDNPEQNELSKEIINYVNTIDYFNKTLGDDYMTLIKSINVPYPKIDENNAAGGWLNDPNYYSSRELKRVHELVRSESFLAIIKTLRGQVIYQKASAFVRYSNGLSIMELIKKYFPVVRLLFQDVGVKGTAIDGFDNVNGKSTQMQLIDKDLEIWEVTIDLLPGRIKFRCRDSWAINWGGENFPKGEGFHDGPDIIVPEKGTYKIVFKPVSGKYEFTKLEE